MYEGKSDKTPKNDTELKLTASTLRVYLEKLDREIKNIEVFIPEKQDRNPRKHELAKAESIRYAARELLKALGMKTTWLEETQMAEKQSKGIKGFSYDDPDGTFYFGYFKSKKAFVDAYLGETGNWGSRIERDWVNERFGTFDEGKYGVEAWVNLGTLCKEELPESDLYENTVLKEAKV
jgi:hypothetical protein